MSAKIQESDPDQGIMINGKIIIKVKKQISMIEDISKKIIKVK